MKQLLFPISIFLFLGFIPNDNKILIEEYQDTIIEHAPWDYNFDFDEVIYYRNNKLTEKKVYKIYKKEKKSHKNELLLKFSWHDRISLADTTKLTKLKKIGYSKIDFPKSKYKLLREYFTSEHNPEPESAESDIYKDILVLRKDNQTTHIIKISFFSEHTEITDNEGYRTIWLGNYEHFEKLLKGEN